MITCLHIHVHTLCVIISAVDDENRGTAEKELMEARGREMKERIRAEQGGENEGDEQGMFTNIIFI